MEIWITEGEFDTLVLCGLGKEAVGLPGTGNTDMFRREWVHIFAGADIYIACDGDEQGRDAAARLRNGFEMSGLHAIVVDVPDKLDINEWYVEDPDGLRQVLNQRR